MYDLTPLVLSAITKLAFEGPGYLPQALFSFLFFFFRPCFLKQGRNQLNNLNKALHNLKSKTICIYLSICYLHINRYIYICTHPSVPLGHAPSLAPPYPWPMGPLTGFHPEVTGGGSWEGEEGIWTPPPPALPIDVRCKFYILLSLPWFLYPRREAMWILSFCQPWEEGKQPQGRFSCLS